MPRQGAGKRYPHVTTDTRPHDHRMCPVTSTIVDAVQAGDEPWGTVHSWTLRDMDTAVAAKRSFYASRYCKDAMAKLGEPLSVQADVEPDGDHWRIWVRVWPRSQARAHIAAKAASGEKLAYNVLRRQ